MSFPTLELAPRDLAKERVKTGEARWVGSRFEDRRKDTGELRCRWVLQDFARTKDTESTHFSATPERMLVELVHVHALVHGNDLRYLDEVRAFPHAPETEELYTEAPAGMTDDPSPVVRTIRRINGHRGGSKGYTDWSAVPPEQMGFKQGKLHPCAFADSERGCWAIKHVNDGVLEGKPALLDEVETQIGKHVMLKRTGELKADDTFEGGEVNFLSRLRSRQNNTILRKPKDKYVKEAAELLGIKEGNAAELPADKATDDLDGDILAAPRACSSAPSWANWLMCRRIW